MFVFSSVQALGTLYVNFLHLCKLFLQYQFLFYKEHIFCGPNELYICMLH